MPGPHACARSHAYKKLYLCNYGAIQLGGSVLEVLHLVPINPPLMPLWLSQRFFFEASLPQNRSALPVVATTCSKLK